MSRGRAAKLLTIGAVALAGLAAAQPLLTSGGRLPWAADTLIHLYRLVELDHLLRHGYLFPRYVPDLAYGFGFPLFNFYAPLSYYLAEIFRLVGMDFSPALLATLVALLIGAGASMYLWCAKVWGQRASLVAAAAYVTAPYLLYNVYHRGALAEVLAMALMPFILWAVTQSVGQDGILSNKYCFLTALLYAALLLGHNITALVFTPIIALYAVVVTYQASHSVSNALRSTLPILLGLGLSAFFWAPAFVERNSVQIFQLFLPEGFDYHFNFVTPGELFSLPVTVDPNLVLQPTLRSIGLIPLALAILTLAFGWRKWNRQQQVIAGFTALLALASLLLTLPQSVAIWDALPLLRFIQFPWRFLGLASLALAFLAGGLFVNFSPQRHQDTKGLQFEKLGVLASWWLIGPLIAGMIVYGFTWQYAPYLPPITRPTVADIARYERESGALGTTSAGDYLPNTVKKLPDANTLVERYSRSDVIERLDTASLPPGAQVTQASYRPLSADVTVESQTPFVAVFDIFDFAGWQASVDGQPVPITPTDPYGLISFPVPASQHRIQVWFGSTLLRTSAGIVSWLSVLALIAVIVLRRADLRPMPDTLHPWPGDLRPAIAVCVFAIGLFAVKSLYLDSRETLFRRTRFDGTHVASVAHPLDVNFSNQLALMGYEPEPLVTDTSRSVRVTLYWRATQKLEADYSISAQLVDERGFVYGQRDSQHPGGYPTSRWTLSDYARDVHNIPLAPGAPPGEYHLRIGVYRVGAPSGLSVLDANGAPAGTTFDAAKVMVTRPGSFLWMRPQLVLPQPSQKSGAQLAPGLVLLGYDLPLAKVNAGAKLPLTFYWQATATQARDLKARLSLVDESGAAISLGDVTPISPQFSTSRLLASDVMRGPNAVRIPASTPGGTFALRIALLDESGQVTGDTAELGRVTIRVPERILNPPSVQYSLRSDLGGQVRLFGYDLSAARLAPGATLTVTLYWQALREIMSEFKSFVHLLDASGRLVAGSDAVPANWTRPTTGWLAGEYVTDPHTLALPANLASGNYRLEVGLYDADTNARLGNSMILEQIVTVTSP